MISTCTLTHCVQNNPLSEYAKEMKDQNRTPLLLIVLDEAARLHTESMRGFCPVVSSSNSAADAAKSVLYAARRGLMTCLAEGNRYLPPRLHSNSFRIVLVPTSSTVSSIDTRPPCYG